MRLSILALSAFLGAAVGIPATAVGDDQPGLTAKRNFNLSTHDGGVDEHLFIEIEPA